MSTQFARTTADQRTLNYFAIDRLTRALDAVRDSSGNIVCRSVVDGRPDCVPYNLFSPAA